MEKKLFDYIVSKQDEWRKIYERQRKSYKYEKQKKEKIRVREKKNNDSILSSYTSESASK